MGKDAYSHHAQMGLTFLSNCIILIDKYKDRIKVMLGIGQDNNPYTDIGT